MTQGDRSGIRIAGLHKSFATPDGGVFTALRDIALDVAENEFVSLLGPSGCGKSTLLEIIAGLQGADAGSVLLDGAPVLKPGPDRAFVFQHFALFPWRTVAGNVEFPMEMAGVPGATRRSRALGFLKMVGLDGFANRHTWQLSGGMQQRVGLARAMACEPRVMLMDEPFSGADAITRELLQNELVKLHRAARKTVVFVTHSVDEAIRLSDRIVVMGTRPGRIVSTFDLDDALRDDKARAAALRDRIWNILRTEIVPVSAEEAK
jgi:ABC-type nitrate/sulfonate/bicarbonate transport system ATPase subunit